jgi:DNA-binding beta-propeller fold protein YncE
MQFSQSQIYADFETCVFPATMALFSKGETCTRSFAMMTRASMLVASVAVLLAIAAGLMAAPAEPAPASELKVLKTVIGSGDGGCDFITADNQGRLAYVTRATRVMVFDIEAGKLVGEVPDVPGAHGVALAPDAGLGFATCGKDNSVNVFDVKTLKSVKRIKTGAKPDAIFYDPASKKVFVCNNGSGDLTVIDPSALDKEPVTLALGGKLEVGVADGAGRAYVNVEDKSEVVAVDTKALKVLAHWPLTGGEGPTGLAIDVAHRRLFSGCGNQQMVVLDADSGKILGTAPIGAGVDGVAFDPTLGIAVSSNGKDGTMTIVREGPAGTFKAVQTLKTAKGAKTIDVDTKTHRFYTPCNIPTEGGKTEFGVIVVGVATP